MDQESLIDRVCVEHGLSCKTQAMANETLHGRGRANTFKPINYEYTEKKFKNYLLPITTVLLILGPLAELA